MENGNRDQIIEKYFHEGYKYNEILGVLESAGINISYRHLQRILCELGLRRKKIAEDEDQIIEAMLSELEGSGQCLGYRSLWQRLKSNYGLKVYRDTVLQLLHLMDPEGIEKRSRYRLKRREYKVPGPNFLWHLDGYDKLKPYGFAIHSCIDGFSRKALWLEVGTSNNNPDIIAYYYLKTVKKLGVLPTIIRSDRGTENSRIELIQQAMRFSHDDPLAGLNSFIKGKSTANQRVESFWAQLRKRCCSFWMDYFKEMVDSGGFSRHDPMQLECLRYCFGPLIKFDIQQFKSEWNRHIIRKQNVGHVISGKPNYLYFQPEKNNGTQCSKPMNIEHVDNAFAQFAEVSTYCSQTMVKLVECLLPNCQAPMNALAARQLYHNILDELSKYD